MARTHWARRSHTERCQPRKNTTLQLSHSAGRPGPAVLRDRVHRVIASNAFTSGAPGSPQSSAGQSSAGSLATTSASQLGCSLSIPGGNGAFVSTIHPARRAARSERGRARKACHALPHAWRRSPARRDRTTSPLANRLKTEQKPALLSVQFVEPESGPLRHAASLQQPGDCQDAVGSIAVYWPGCGMPARLP